MTGNGRWGGALLAVWLGLTGCGGMEPAEPATEDLEVAQAGMSRPRFEYSEDFQGSVGPEWSPSRTSVTPLGGRRFLGGFASEGVSLTLDSLPQHDTVTVSFDLFILLSWDGNDTFYGPDVWRLRVEGGPTLLETSFSNDDVPYVPSFSQSYPGAFADTERSFPGLTGAIEKGTLGYPDLTGYQGVGDSVYRVSFTFPHTGGTLKLRFEDLPRPDANEQWGLDNVRVTVGSNQGLGQPRWVLHPQGLGSDAAQAVTHDRDRNIIVAGLFDGRIEGDGLTLESGVSFTPMLVKLRPDGQRIWARVIANGEAAPLQVTTDRARNIIVAGLAHENIDFGTGLLLEGAFLAKFDPRGRLLWARTYPELRFQGLATDGLNHLYATGNVLGDPVDFGLGPIERRGNIGSLGFLVKFSPEGTALWQRAGGPEARFRSLGLTVDSQDQVYVTGMGFDSRPFLEAISPGGQLLWTRTLATEGEARDVAVHGNRVVVTGSFSEAFPFRKSLLRPTFANGSFLAAYTRAGEERWARVLGGFPTALSMDPRDGVVVTGSYMNSADFGLGPVYGESLGHNFFVAKYERIRGEVRWVRPFPNNGGNPRDVASAQNGESTIVGSFSGPSDFGFGAVSTSNFNSDLFILELGQ